MVSRDDVEGPMFMPVYATVTIHAEVLPVEDSAVLSPLSFRHVRLLKLFDTVCKLALATVVARVELDPILAQLSLVPALAELQVIGR